MTLYLHWQATLIVTPAPIGNAGCKMDTIGSFYIPPPRPAGKDHVERLQPCEAPIEAYRVFFRGRRQEVAQLEADFNEMHKLM